MAISIKIDVFEGPLDLLLHLIKKAEVDIYDIPIFDITEQYIEYLNEMKELDLEIASEFLVMAATLIEIKSRMLLPKKKKEEGEEEVEDPREELVRKLLEYKKYKEFAEDLKYIEENHTIYFKEPEIIEDVKPEEVLFKNITVENLMIAFKKVMDSYENKHISEKRVYENISEDKYKIEDKIEIIKDMLSGNSRIYFEVFFEKCQSKIEIIVTFIAMLELIKQLYIHVYQKNNFDKIVIERQV